MTTQNPTRKTPPVAYPRLMSELFYQCGIIKRIMDAQVPDLLEEQRANFINGHTLANMRLLKEAVKVPNHPLLVKKPSGPLPEVLPMLFDNEPKKDKKRKRVAKVKQEEASEDKAVEATDSENKTTSEKSKGKTTKKQRSERKKAPKVQMRMVIQEEDDEETDEEPLKNKRTRQADSEQVHQPEPEGMNIEATAYISNSSNDNVTNFQAQTPPISSPLNKPDVNIDSSLLKPLNVIHPPQTSDLPPITSEPDLDTVAEGIKIATQLQKNKTNELSSLIQGLSETHVPSQTQSQHSSPLEILESHLQ
ncbi:hypothetical protein A2U01_0014908, partial [Trifolium medium]|nr:hypothetical protein [Trifolium medium]